MLKEAHRRTWRMAQDADAIIFHMTTTYAIDIAEALNIPAIMTAFQPLNPTGEFPYIGTEAGGRESPAPQPGAAAHRHQRLQARSDRQPAELRGAAGAAVLLRFPARPFPAQGAGAQAQEARRLRAQRPRRSRDRAPRLFARHLAAPARLARQRHRHRLLAASTTRPAGSPTPRSAPSSMRVPRRSISALARCRSAPSATPRSSPRRCAPGAAAPSSARAGAGSEPRTCRPTVHSIARAPHPELFKYVKAVVHHGGAGTTHTGLYAGKPTFVVPAVLRPALLGPPRARPRLWACAGAAAKADADHSRQRARPALDQQRPTRPRQSAWREILQAEDGIGRAIEVIEATMVLHPAQRGQRETRSPRSHRDRLRRQQHLRQDAPRRDPRPQGLRGRRCPRDDGHLPPVARPRAGDPQGAVAQPARRRPGGARAGSCRRCSGSAGRSLRRPSADGLRLVQYNEAPAGQSVFHLHFHLMPVYEGRAVRRPWPGPRRRCRTCDAGARDRLASLNSSRCRQISGISASSDV